MKINRNNYEIWFLDYFEGRLSDEQVKELMEFLDLHYDLKEEFDSFENVSLPPAKKVVFDSKSILKKNVIASVGDINEKNYNDFFIGFYEGDLTDAEKSNVLQFVEKNPFLKKDFELFSKTKAEADKSVIFSAKASLKKQRTVEVKGISEVNYAEYFIAAAEGDLQLLQLSDLKEFLTKNPHLEKEYQLFKNTKVTPDTSIFFDRKELLKKPVAAIQKTRVRSLYYAVSAAASVIVLLSIYFLMNRENASNVRNMAYRADIELNKNLQHNDAEQIIENAKVPVYNYGSSQQNSVHGSNSDMQMINTLSADCIYASSGNTGIIQGSNPEILPKKTVYEDYYAMKLEKIRNEAPAEEKKDNRFMSLKDFALFNAKKAAMPEEKKDAVTPETKITGWDLAQTGVEKVGKLSGTDARLSRNDNNKGFKISLGQNFELAYNPAR